MLLWLNAWLLFVELYVLVHYDDIKTEKKKSNGRGTEKEPIFSEIHSFPYKFYEKKTIICEKKDNLC